MSDPRPNEVLLKNWKRKIAEELGVKVHALEQRLSSGRYPYPTVRRINSKVIYVQTIPDYEI